MLTIVLVCVPGGIYNYNHVLRLASQINKYMSIPYQFHVIWESDKPGWWAKIDLFEPGRFHGRMLYLDLDINIVNDLEPLTSMIEPFIAIKDFQHPMTINSSVMVWDAGYADHIYTDFEPSVMEKYRGDQNWINNRIPNATRFPEKWCLSYKKDIQGLPPYDDVVEEAIKDTKVIVYHGDPKPWNILASVGD